MMAEWDLLVDCDTGDQNNDGQDAAKDAAYYTGCVRCSGSIMKG